MNNKDKNISIAIKLRKAKATLNEIDHLLQFAYFNTALNRLYYACFYAVQALLLSKDLAPKSHKGLRTLLSQHFIKEKKFPEELNGFYTRIFDERQFADYMDVEEFDKESIHLLSEKAKNFIAHIEKLLDEKK